MFFIILASIVSACNHTKCVMLNNQKLMSQHTLINFHPNEYSQGLCYYLFADDLVGICNTLYTYLVEYVLHMKHKI